MKLLISLGLLVFVLSYIVRSYRRVLQLRSEVQAAWVPWTAAARLRNDRLLALLGARARRCPTGKEAEQTLQQLLAEEEALLAEALPSAEHAQDIFYRTESGLHRLSTELLACAERCLPPDSDALRSTMDELAHAAERWRGAALRYNQALSEPPQRLLAPLFACYAVPPHLPPDRNETEKK